MIALINSCKKLYLLDSCDGLQFIISQSSILLNLMAMATYIEENGHFLMSRTNHQPSNVEILSFSFPNYSDHQMWLAFHNPIPNYSQGNLVGYVQVEMNASYDEGNSYERRRKVFEIGCAIHIFVSIFINF